MAKKSAKWQEARKAAARRDLVRRMVARGDTFSDIGIELGISRQRAYQLYLGPKNLRKDL
jgi:hypothetical protein